MVLHIYFLTLTTLHCGNYNLAPVYSTGVVHDECTMFNHLVSQGHILHPLLPLTTRSSPSSPPAIMGP